MRLDEDSNCTLVELDCMTFSSRECGEAVLTKFPYCSRLNLRKCIGSFLDDFVEACLCRLPNLQHFSFIGGVWNVKSFPPGCSLKVLNLMNSRFDSSTAIQIFADGLNKSSHVEEITLCHCFLQDDDLTVILKQLPKSIHIVDLTGNFCRSNGAEALGNLLRQEDRALTTINLTDQHPGQCGGSLDLSLLGLALAVNTTLQHLDLSFNMLTCCDIESLMGPLAKNTTLRSINFMSNALDDRAMQMIGEHLPRFRGLKSLNIMANRFGECGANALLEGLRTNPYLCDLVMRRGFLASESIDYYLAFNKGGRRLLYIQSPVVPCPLSLWPLVFERINRLNGSEPLLGATIIFELLQGPAVFGKRISNDSRDVIRVSTNQPI